jgi:hypothetical protein
MLFSLISFETQTCITIWELFVILFLLQLHVCDLYLLNHVILVVKLIYRGLSWHSADYRVYISESMCVSTFLVGTVVTPQVFVTH